MAASDAQPVLAIVAIQKDGTDGQVYPLFHEQTDLGRTEGHVVLSDDPYLSPRHARLLRRGTQVVLQDLGSLNGIYYRIHGTVPLEDRDTILMGQQVLRFEVIDSVEVPLGPAATQGVMVFGTPLTARHSRLTQYSTEGVGRDVHYLYREETVLGREHGDIVFTDDPFLSRRHAAIAFDRSARRFSLRDLGSSNGTALRTKADRVLGLGDFFRVGRHLFRLGAGGATSGGVVAR